MVQCFVVHYRLPNAALQTCNVIKQEVSSGSTPLHSEIDDIDIRQPIKPHWYKTALVNKLVLRA